MPFPIKVLLLALKPLSKTADIWDLRDIANIVIQAVGWGGGWLMLNNFDWFNPYWLAIFPAVLLFIAALKLQRKVDDYESQSPCIIFGQGEVATGNIYETKEFTPIDQPINRSKALGLFYMVYVFVKNDPPSGHRAEERTAGKAAAIIEVYEPANLKTPTKSYWGKWRDKPQASSRPHHVPIADLMELDLPPNGIPHRIDFALKYDVDEDMYGYNDEAHRYCSDGRFVNLKLPPNRFFVRVSLKAVGLKDKPSGWYEISHKGKQSKPTIRQLSKDELKL